ncbi:MAG: FtsX-like permease family protein [Acidobacteriota bacterium]|nr:FtsX-like permease family protein [Acidobacteriota bacterium]
MLTIAIGVTTVMFALSDPFILRPLPYQDPGRLFVIRTTFDGRTAGFTGGAPMPALADWESRVDLFQAVAAYGQQERIRVDSDSGARIVIMIPVTPNLLAVLDAGGPVVQHAMSDQDPDAAILVSGGLAAAEATRADWSARGLRSQEGRVWRVLGTTDDGFLFPLPRATGQPGALRAARFRHVIEVSPGRTEDLVVIARAQPGVGPSAVQAALRAQHASSPVTIVVQPLQEYMTRGLKLHAISALAAAMLIALVSVANIINLFIARGSYRVREFAMRLALGANTSDLRRLLAIELTAVTVLAAAAGMIVASLVLGALTQTLPAEYARLGRPEITARVFLFLLTFSAAVVMVAVLPIWMGWKAGLSNSVSQALSQEARRLRWLRSIIAASQAAAAMIVLIGGLMLVRSYAKLMAVESGFSGPVFAISVSYPRTAAPSQIGDYVARTVEDLQRVPGTAAAGAVAGPLLEPLNVFGGAALRVGERVVLLTPKEVTPDFFRAAGTAIRAGRDFQARESDRGAIIVNERFARLMRPDGSHESLVGTALRSADGAEFGRIIGVVQDIHDRALDTAVPPLVFRPLSAPRASLPVNYLVRFPRRDPGVQPIVERVVRAVEPDAVVTTANWVDERLALSVTDRTFATLMLSFFTIAGIGITASGLFGVVAFAVARRTKEIAVRRALGARGRDVVGLVARQALGAAAAGTLAGLVVGRWLSRILESYLFGVSPGDPLSLAGAVAVMVVVVLLGACVPALRALKLLPSEALRVD